MQYVGARYVMKIYENSLNPASNAWENTEYEPFTVVSYLNNSYISKKQVPVNAGTPNTATEYWTLFGFSSGQIVQLQHDVAELDERLSLFDDRKFIFIYDSYGDYVDANNTKLRDLVAQYAGIADYNAYTFGGYGFTNVNMQGTFLEALQSLTISDPDSITDIVVLGGQNDYGQNAANIISAINGFCTYVKTNFPNAHITIGHDSMARRHAADMRTAIYSNYVSIRAYRSGASRNGAKYLHGTEFLMHSTQYFENTLTHPNTDGVTWLATNIAQALLSGSCDVIISSDEAYDTTAADSVFSSVAISTGLINATLEDGTTHLNFSGGRITCTLAAAGYIPTGFKKIADADFSVYPLVAVGDSSSNLLISNGFAIIEKNDGTYAGICPVTLKIGSDGDLMVNFAAGISPNPADAKILYLTGFAPIVSDSTNC